MSATENGRATGPLCPACQRNPQIDDGDPRCSSCVEAGAPVEARPLTVAALLDEIEGWKIRADPNINGHFDDVDYERRRADRAEIERDRYAIAFRRVQGALTDAGIVVVPDEPEQAEDAIKTLAVERDRLQRVVDHYNGGAGYCDGCPRCHAMHGEEVALARAARLEAALRCIADASPYASKAMDLITTKARHALDDAAGDGGGT